MHTEKIKISHDGTSFGDALKIAENFADEIKLTGKNKFHVMLLTEEMLSMFKAITGEFDAYFWIEFNEDEKTYSLKLKADAPENIDYAKRRDLLSVSTQGKNIAPRGIMEKVRELWEAGLYNLNESLDIHAEYDSGLLDYVSMGMVNPAISPSFYSWSMRKYKNNVETEKDENKTALEAWDELEKSIIANVADDVQVGVKNKSAELIVLKKLQA